MAVSVSRIHARRQHALLFVAGLLCWLGFLLYTVRVPTTIVRPSPRPLKLQGIAAAINTSVHACSRASKDRASYPLRSKLMIIISETTDRKGRQDTAHVVDNFSKYAAMHGYLFKLHQYDADPAVGVFGTRWKDASRYW